MGIYEYIIGICLIFTLSHIFNIISEKTKIPSVIMLIILGIVVKKTMLFYGYNIMVPFKVLQILGTVGLVLIVLEGTIELQLSSDKIGIMKKALNTSLLLLILSIITIAGIITLALGTSYINAIIYAIPISIISSAMVIPSIKSLTEIKKEFIIYEATFSDIIGIIIFNLFAYGNINSLIDITEFSLSLIMIILVSILFSILLIFILGKTKEGTKIVMILSVLLLIYSIGKTYHLSSLILILVFGIIINNFDEILNFFKIRQKTEKIFNVRSTFLALREMKLINRELSFAIRTLFFFVFGFSMEIEKILKKEIILSGIVIILLIYLIRYINLKVILKENVFPEIMIAPRGLITILLYYSIPKEYQIEYFEEGVLFFIIIVTSIVMMIGLLCYKKPKE